MDIRSLGYIITILIGSTYGLGEDSVETRLYNDMFQNYNRKVRPVKGSDYYQQIVVGLVFTLTQLESLNEKLEKMTSYGAIWQTWRDELLQWNATDYNGAKYIVVQAKDLWLPEITAMNSVSGSNDIAHEDVTSRARVYNDGTIAWAPLMKWETACSMDVTYFPYDQQECVMSFANWIYTAEFVNFSIMGSLAVNEFEPNPGWNLTDSITWTEVRIIDGSQFPFAKVKLTLQRNPFYFEMNVIFPALLLSFLLVPMFILPVESGEKVSLGVTLMLSYAIFLLMLAEYTPQSGSIPSLSVGFLICILFAGMGMVTNVCIINIHYHSPNRQVPSWVKTVFLKKLGLLLCCMKYADEQASDSKVKPVLIRSENENSKDTLKQDLSTNAHLAYLEFFKAKKLDEEEVEQNKEDWNKVARVIDRLFLVLYLVYFVIYLFVILSFKWSHG